MSLSILFVAVLVFTRLAGMFSAMPVFGSNMFPSMIRLILMLTITMVLLPSLSHIDIELSFGMLFVNLFKEICIGFSMGFIVNLAYYGLLTGTEMLSTQIGQAAAKQFNPSMQMSQSPIGGMAVLLSMAVFLGENLHLTMIQLIAESFVLVPPLEIVDPLRPAIVWIDRSKMLFVMAIQIAAPILVFVFLNNCFLGVLSRLAQSMNVFFSVGFQVSMMVGLTLFTYLLPSYIEFVTSHAVVGVNLIPEILAIAGGG
jgi:flagellar biosynthesis protein FliR